MKNFATKTFNTIKRPLMITLVLMVICGLIYTLALTGLGQLFFPHQANGSLLYDTYGNVIGSSLIGQETVDARFMKCRPSAYGYNQYTEEDIKNGDYSGVGSGSENLAPSNPALQERVEKQIAEIIALFAKYDLTITVKDIPADLVTASGSGLDPHITPRAAEFQAPLLVKTTGLTLAQINSIIADNTSERLVGVFGEPTVNVLGVNIAIAKLLNITK